MNIPRTDHFHLASPRLSALAVGVLLGLYGCAAVAPPGADLPPVDVPAQWSGATGGAAHTVSSAALSQWWLGFNDPLLSSLVADALQANTTVTGAQAALLQARALRDVSAASLSPTLGSSLSAQRSGGDGGTGNSFQAGLDASWEVDVFGGNHSAVRASEAAANASAASLADTQVSVAAEVALNYIALRGAQERLVVANNSLISQQDTRQITGWRLQAGLVTSLEDEQSRAAVEQTRAQLPLLQITISQTEHAIAVLTGRSPAALAAMLDPVAPVPQPVGDMALSFPAETLRQRPDIRAAEFQVIAASARVAQADAARLPSFRLGGSLGLNALTLAGLSSGATFASALLASVSLPLFDGGLSNAQLRAQEAALEQARISYKATVLTALKDVEDALVALRGDRQRLASLLIAGEAADNAALMASQRYNSGLVDFQVVLETQRTQLGTHDSIASAMAAVSADHVRLYKALGGGWRPDAADATPPPASDLSRTPNL